MAKPNYDRVKRQKEAMRKQKKQEKMLRKQARTTEGQPGDAPEAAAVAGEPLAAQGENPAQKLEP